MNRKHGKGVHPLSTFCTSILPQHSGNHHGTGPTTTAVAVTVEAVTVTGGPWRRSCGGDRRGHGGSAAGSGGGPWR
jgi:hypothetical protein